MPGPKLLEFIFNYHCDHVKILLLKIVMVFSKSALFQDWCATRGMSKCTNAAATSINGLVKHGLMKRIKSDLNGDTYVLVNIYPKLLRLVETTEEKYSIEEDEEMEEVKKELHDKYQEELNNIKAESDKIIDMLKAELENFKQTSQATIASCREEIHSLRCELNNYYKNEELQGQLNSIMEGYMQIMKKFRLVL